MMIARHSNRDDAGFSLPELLVTILVFGIVGTMVVTFFTNVTRSFTEDRAASDSINIAAIGMDELTRVIRSGTEIEVQGQTLNNPVFVSAKNEDVTLYAFLDTNSANPKPVKVRFYVDTNRILKETRWDAYVVNAKYFSFNTAATSTRDIARLITPRVAPDLYLFTYYKADGTQLVVPTTGTFTTAQLRSIVAVKVTMTVQADLTERANPVRLENTVGIPNLGVSRVGP
jgi:prepilin-type N-terminal cleavage/methylation domain-containing protein